MKKLFTLLVLILSFSFTSFGQTGDEAIEVETSVVKISDTEYDLVLNFFIEESWHLYSQYNPKDASLPMSIKPSEGEKGFEVVGKAKESETTTAFSNIWGVDEIFFVEEAVLTQRIKLQDPSLRQVSLNVEAQVCKEYCLPYDGDFTFVLDGGKVVETVAEVDERSKDIVNSLKLNLQNTELLNETKDTGDSKSLLNIFILGFLGGLIAFITPCVFPMVPLTVSYFTKQAKNKVKGSSRAIMYGFFIVLIYVLLSLPFHFIDTLDPEILTNISTNVWLNLFFFVILLFFAGSFFGFYHITLPSSWGNKIDSASTAGGIIGTFFMALTLAIVSFSCTGPILGSLLASSLSSDGGAMELTAGMAGFGLSLALPFVFFALFPNLINKLPKSGDWLNMVTVLVGFIEIALAFKFLSNADLVGHWGLLKREVFIGIWILILVCAALFLFGIIKFPGSKTIKRIAFMRVVLGFIVLAGAVYLAPGLMKKPIWEQSLLSGLAPPQYHSIYKSENKCPLSLNCFKDFDEGLAYAKKVNKPILLDFTGLACVNCRRMEDNTWSDPEIYKILRDEYILISLYVDDNERKLPVDEQFDYIKPNGKVKKIRTYGGKWSTMQTVNFQNNSLPFYVLMTPGLKILNTPKQYSPDKVSYYKWLEKGVKNFKK